MKYLLSLHLKTSGRMKFISMCYVLCVTCYMYILYTFINVPFCSHKTFYGLMRMPYVLSVLINYWSPLALPDTGKFSKQCSACSTEDSLCSVTFTLRDYLYLEAKKNSDFCIIFLKFHWCKNCLVISWRKMKLSIFNKIIAWHKKLDFSLNCL